MSVEFELRRVSLTPVNIDEMVTAWLTASRVQANSVRLPDGIVEVFVPGISIRGLVVRRRWAWFIERIELRLSVVASHGDWRAAYSLLRFARQQGFNVRDEDGNTIEDDSLTDEVAILLPRGEFDPANCVYVPWSRAVQDLSGIIEEPVRTFVCEA